MADADAAPASASPSSSAPALLLRQRFLATIFAIVALGSLLNCVLLGVVWSAADPGFDPPDGWETDGGGARFAALLFASALFPALPLAGAVALTLFFKPVRETRAHRCSLGVILLIAATHLLSLALLKSRQVFAWQQAIQAAALVWRHAALAVALAPRLVPTLTASSLQTLDFGPTTSSSASPRRSRKLLRALLSGPLPALLVVTMAECTALAVSGARSEEEASPGGLIVASLLFSSFYGFAALAHLSASAGAARESARALSAALEPERQAVSELLAMACACVVHVAAEGGVVDDSCERLEALVARRLKGSHFSTCLYGAEEKRDFYAGLFRAQHAPVVLKSRLISGLDVDLVIVARELLSKSEAPHLLFPPSESSTLGASFGFVVGVHVRSAPTVGPKKPGPSKRPFAASDARGLRDHDDDYHDLNHSPPAAFSSEQSPAPEAAGKMGTTPSMGSSASAPVRVLDSMNSLKPVASINQAASTAAFRKAVSNVSSVSAGATQAQAQAQAFPSSTSAPAAVQAAPAPAPKAAAKAAAARVKSLDFTLLPKDSEAPMPPPPSSVAHLTLLPETSDAGGEKPLNTSEGPEASPQYQSGGSAGRSGRGRSPQDSSDRSASPWKKSASFLARGRSPPKSATAPLTRFGDLELKGAGGEGCGSRDQADVTETLSVHSCLLPSRSEGSVPAGESHAFSSPVVQSPGRTGSAASLVERAQQLFPSPSMLGRARLPSPFSPRGEPRRARSADGGSSSSRGKSGPFAALRRALSSNVEPTESEEARILDASLEQQRKFGAQSKRGGAPQEQLDVLDYHPHVKTCFDTFAENEDLYCAEWGVFYHSYSYAALIYEFQAAVAGVLFDFPSSQATLPRIGMADFLNTPNSSSLIQQFNQKYASYMRDHHPDYRAKAISVMCSLVALGPEVSTPTMFLAGFSQYDVKFDGVLQKALASCHIPQKKLHQLSADIIALSERFGLDVSLVGGKPCESGRSGHLLQIFIRRTVLDDMAYSAHPYGELDSRRHPISKWLASDEKTNHGQARVLCHPKWFLEQRDVKMFVASADQTFHEKRMEFQSELMALVFEAYGSDEVRKEAAKDIMEGKYPEWWKQQMNREERRRRRSQHKACAVQ